MKILLVADTYPPHVNGAALAAERLALALSEKGHDVFVMATATSFGNTVTRQKNITVYRLRSIPFPLSNTQRFRFSPKPFHVKEVNDIIQDLKPDIVHVFETAFIGITAVEVAKKEQIPVIASHHVMPENFVEYFRVPATAQKMVNYTLWKIYTHVYKNLEIVICPTLKATQLVARHTKGIKLQTISNGINTRLFNPKNNGKYLKERYQLPKKTTLLFVGRLDREKYVDVLIKAAAILKDKVNFHVVIAGKGNEAVRLRGLAEKLGMNTHITFTGYMPKKDLPNIYKTADIFVMPGIAELQSIVTMEAMASGLPIVGADAVALPELIHPGKNGFLFKPKSEKECAAKLLTLIQDGALRTKMGKESLKIIADHDMQLVVSQFEKAYSNALLLHKNTNTNFVLRTNFLTDLKRIYLTKKVKQR